MKTKHTAAWEQYMQTVRADIERIVQTDPALDDVCDPLKFAGQLYEAWEYREEDAADRSLSGQMAAAARKNIRAGQAEVAAVLAKAQKVAERHRAEVLALAPGEDARLDLMSRCAQDTLDLKEELAAAQARVEAGFDALARAQRAGRTHAAFRLAEEVTLALATASCALLLRVATVEGGEAGRTHPVRGH